MPPIQFVDLTRHSFLLRQRLPLPAPPEPRPARRLLGALVLAAVVAAGFVWMAVLR